MSEENMTIHVGARGGFTVRVVNGVARMDEHEFDRVARHLAKPMRPRGLRAETMEVKLRFRDLEISKFANINTVKMMRVPNPGRLAFIDLTSSAINEMMPHMEKEFLNG